MVNLPRYIDIELNTSCNLHCEQCPYHEAHKDPMYMSWDVYKQIIDQIDWEASIKLCQRGEPLLSPILIQAIRYAHKKGLRTVINTNGKLLYKFTLQLIKANVTCLILSDYGKEFQYKAGIRFSVINQTYGKPVRFIVKSEDKIKWEGIADKVINPLYYEYNKRVDDSTPLPDWKCPQLFERLVIDPNGHVRCCCGDVKPQKYIGNVKTRSLKSIWDGVLHTKYCSIHEKGLSHLLVMCRKCAYRADAVLSNGNNKQQTKRDKK